MASNKKSTDYTALYAIDGIAPIAPGKRPPVPSTIRNSNKPYSNNSKTSKTKTRKKKGV